MAHPDAETPAQSYRVTHHIIRLQTDGLAHEDGLLHRPLRSRERTLGQALAGLHGDETYLTGQLELL